MQAGDHVKVNSGQHEGQTGMVVRVEDPICVLVSDSTHEELQVFARDLTESSEAATGLDRCLLLPLHDCLTSHSPPCSMSKLNASSKRLNLCTALTGLRDSMTSTKVFAAAMC